MKLLLKTASRALNPAYRKQPVRREDMERFKTHLRLLLHHLNPGETEENAKGHFAAFLRDAFYGQDHLIATLERADLVIHNGPKADSSAAVLFEVKRPRAEGHAAADMIRPDRPNVKALHELILYFFRQRDDAHNTDLKYLVATDIHQLFLFDAADFERLFYRNKSLLREYRDWREGRKTDNTTDFFYTHIARPFLEALEEDLPCVQADIRAVKDLALNDDPADDPGLIPLYKLLSPIHLLRLPFANDSNSLNKEFYYELLHLIGLEEAREGNKRVIRRKPPGERHPGSLLENTIHTLETEERIGRVSRRHLYGDHADDQIFGIALELCITWINRILFLKLLEAQLREYHDGDPAYRFLHTGLLDSYDALNELFFEVLARQPDERNPYAHAHFRHVPYLNSSLFEISSLEAETIRINSLKDRHTLPVYARSVLRDAQGRRRSSDMQVLDYLFAFLDAYNFSSEGSGSIQEDNKTLINASVLGLIFEKINGYQDGAFFTPGFITMYMCRETLRRAIVQQFRESDHFEDFDSESFDDLRNYLGRHYRQEDLREANVQIDRLKVCDPAVGSGHFLVSALNELLTIKSELGILCDREGRPLPLRVQVANDELSVQWKHNDELYRYRPGVQESQRVQEALFHEKQTLIEGCLFGVDINPNSVKICRLRLWIELLKNAYYVRPGELETLPNIDINIKRGNSLVSRFTLDEDLRPLLRKNKWNINDYRIAVASYHSARDKTSKHELLAQIDRIKAEFRTHIFNNDPAIKRLSKLKGQKNLLENRAEIGDLFEKLSEADVAQDLEKLDAQIERLDAEIAAIRDSAIYRDAFEWRFEFPEVLDEEGDFRGFDVVLGNPPYIRQEELTALKPYLKERYATFAGTADLLVYFIERGYQLLKPEGHFSFIISNKFMRAGFGRALREWLAERRLLNIIDFGDLPVFEEATTYPCILSWQKAAPTETFLAANVPELPAEDFGIYLRGIAFRSRQDSLQAEGWTLADAATQRLLEKLRSKGMPLGEYVRGKIFYGIKTGLNEAFVIDAATCERLIAEDPRSEEVIKPFLAGRDVKRYQVPVANKFLILFPKGWTHTRAGAVDEAQAWAYLQKEYPAIAAHLHPFAAAGRKRHDQGDYWWELRACDYYEEFEREKIIYQVFQVKPAFVYDADGFYTNNAIWIITESNKTLLGILNSKLGWFLISQYCTAIQNGYQLIAKYLMQIPISTSRSEKIEAKVDELQIIKSINPFADTSALEDEIDALVYALYGLKEEEIRVVNAIT